MFKFLRSRRGQGMVEYVLIIAVVVGIIFTVYKTMGGKVAEQFTKAANTIQNADNGGGSSNSNSSSSSGSGSSSAEPS